MNRRKKNRENCDAVVLALLDRPHDTWVTLRQVADETGLSESDVASTCRFLEGEYAVVQYVRGSISYGHLIHSRARLVHGKLEDYEAGTCRDRPGRLHAPEFAWPAER